jgi:hypothetical protein
MTSPHRVIQVKFSWAIAACAACLEATRSETYGGVMASSAQVVAPLDAPRFGARLAAEQRAAQALLGRLGLLVQ